MMGERRVREGEEIPPIPHQVFFKTISKYIVITLFWSDCKIITCVLPGGESTGKAVHMAESILFEVAGHNVGPISGAANQNHFLVFGNIQTVCQNIGHGDVA